MIIRAHSVPMLPSGLSPMQERLLRSDKLVRLVSAPTGCGKSYAFMRAVLEENARVLFIVPTKRLLQNLIEDAREQATRQLRSRGWANDQIDGWIDDRITEWSGNQTADGGETLATRRARELLGGRPAGGRVIFAIPEVVIRMISGVRLTGASAVNPFLYPRMFDHIVFDEFHTIDDRAFGPGLPVLVAGGYGATRKSLAVVRDPCRRDPCAQTDRCSDRGSRYGCRGGCRRAPRPGTDRYTETLPCPYWSVPIPESIAANIDAVQMSLRDRRTVIVIYDSLARLKKDEPEIRTTLRRAGVTDARLLLINSIDDSERKPGEPQRGVRYRDPREYDVLVCTSSVEIGVTFHSALMFMEPGHGLASFVQRVGRVARGAVDGQVIVSLPERRRNRQAPGPAESATLFNNTKICASRISSTGSCTTCVVVLNPRERKPNSTRLRLEARYRTTVACPGAACSGPLFSSSPSGARR